MLAFVLGMLTWSFLEYVIHRWLGHDGRFQPNPFASEHTRHHGEGNYFAPSWKKGATALAVTMVMLGPAISAVGLVSGLAYVAGFVGTYLSYELLHRREHTHPGVGAWGRRLRRHHFHHHFGDPKSNHGVTSPVWDWVFGTYQAPGVIRVPSRLAMPWLVDPETGRARDEHSRHYEVVGVSR
jgi:sterol desaturase/sphingolipid hydroxylase (fatty acid hydroxylase superfamily)